MPFFTPEPIVTPWVSILIFIASGTCAFSLSMATIRAVLEGHWIDAIGIAIALCVTTVIFKELGGPAAWALATIAATAACWWMGTTCWPDGDDDGKDQRYIPD